MVIVALQGKNNSYFEPSLSALHWKIFSRYWWVMLFLVLVYCAYSRSINEKQRELTTLKEILLDLEQKKQLEEERNEELLAHRESRSDSEYIKLLLMKNLGLVSDGQVKVSFQ